MLVNNIITYKNFLLKLFQYPFELFQKKALVSHPQRYHHVVTTAQPSVQIICSYLRRCLVINYSTSQLIYLQTDHTTVSAIKLNTLC